MNELAPTKQQRDIIDGLAKTLDTFNPAQSPFTDGPAPQPASSATPASRSTAAIRRKQLRARRSTEQLSWRESCFGMGVIWYKYF